MKQVGLLPFDFPFGRRPLVQGEDNVCLPSQGDALGYVLVALQAVSTQGVHYFRKFSQYYIRCRILLENLPNRLEAHLLTENAVGINDTS